MLYHSPLKLSATASISGLLLPELQHRPLSNLIRLFPSVTVSVPTSTSHDQKSWVRLIGGPDTVEELVVEECYKVIQSSNKSDKDFID